MNHQEEIRFDSLKIVLMPVGAVDEQSRKNDKIRIH